MDCSPPGSPVHGILQARILEWVALLQGIFLTHRSHPYLLCLLHWQAGVFFYSCRLGSPVKCPETLKCPEKTQKALEKLFLLLRK